MIKKVIKTTVILAGVLVTAAVFLGLTLPLVAPKWLVHNSYLLGACLLFLVGMVIGQEWESLEKGFLAVCGTLVLGLVVGCLFTYLPILYGVPASSFSVLATFLIGRAIIAFLFWGVVGLVGVFVGAGTNLSKGWRK